MDAPETIRMLVEFLLAILIALGTFAFKSFQREMAHAREDFAKGRQEMGTLRIEMQKLEVLLETLRERERAHADQDDMRFQRVERDMENEREARERDIVTLHKRVSDRPMPTRR